MNGQVLGMLYIVEVRMVLKSTGEKVKEKILLVGCESADIERKLKWSYDQSKYSEFSVKSVEKVREKIHVISTVITQEKSPASAVIDRSDGSQVIPHPVMTTSQPFKKYAVGISTTVNAADREHAIRKVGRALINSSSEISHSGASLSEDSTVTVEEISYSSGYSSARDVSNEVNRATFVRG